jgi:hypothetical protein
MMSSFARFAGRTAHALKVRNVQFKELGLNKSLRIIISMRVENEPEALAQGTNVSS